MAAALWPSAWRAAARLAVTVDLPTPPLPEPTQITFLTAASAPWGSPPWRPRRCWRVCFSSAESTSKPTRTCSTPSSWVTFSRTAVSKCDRMGQPGVVSDTITSTAPSEGCSIERTIPRETMSLRSSGSMTFRRASVICSVVGIAFIQAEAASAQNHAFPVRGPHWDRGPIGHFGAPRSGGRTHQGLDIMARCGTPVVAARRGRVVKNIYDPVLYGYLVIVRNHGLHRDYWYAHLAHRSRVHGRVK